MYLSTGEVAGLRRELPPPRDLLWACRRCFLTFQITFPERIGPNCVAECSAQGRVNVMASRVSDKS